MADFTPSFEHQILEADIARLSAEIQGHRARPESKNLKEQELLKRSLTSFTQTVSSPKHDEPSPSPLPAYAQSAPAQTKLEIERLLDIAFHHGILKAATEAKKSSSFVVDAFHDALIEKLYPELQKRGILK